MVPNDLMCRLKAITPDRWSNYNTNWGKKSVEGLSILIEPAMKVSIEKRITTDITNGPFGKSTMCSSYFVLEIRDGKDIIWDSKGSAAEEIYSEIKRKIAKFESLPEERKKEIINLRKSDSLQKLFSSLRQEPVHV